MIGFPPRYGTTHILENRSAAEQIAISKVAMEKLGWHISRVTTDTIIAFTRFSIRSWNEQVSVQVREDGLHLLSVSTGPQLFDCWRNRQNIGRFLKMIDTVAPEVFPPATPEATHLLEPRRIPANLLQAIKPVEGYFITPLLIGLNILFFLILTNKLLFPASSWWAVDQQLLQEAGQNFKPLTLFGQPWRLLTSCFLHKDVFHLFFNMYGLMICGMYLEPLLGKWRFLIVYLLCALASGLASLWWYDITPSLGASGAIFGLFGLLFSLLLRPLVEPVERKALLTSISIYIGSSLIALFFVDGFDHAAHTGGLLTGILLGWLLYPGLSGATSLRKNMTLTATFMSALLVSIYFLLPRDVHTYIRKLERLDENFILAAGAYTTRAEDDREKWLKNFGIYYMDENLRIMDEIDQLSLGQDSRRHNKLLRRMINTQKEMFTYSYKTLQEGKNKYDQQIINAIHELDKMQKQLGQ